ncbi:putative Glycosyl transferase group 1 [Candidatus Competibacter denitrificans Run_A_D11]|uniref:Glycosyl transferase group 1 n=1 Tax=Candidatus Competibacter denitrificans Run_A_D11 TaxID=1400863 RepID=W6M8R1_9GAMM|nr:glycosyltransferase [Candidatus Competibacter denitrificans]CDI03962.1 putative Glycosyl transferase group 1 [Candidatus Competibacter denitrificans Run_A_D11]
MNSIRVMQLGSPTGLYGAERWILALIRHLDSTKVESIVSVIRDAPDLTAPLCTKAQELGFRTHIFEAYGRLNCSAIKQLRQFILSEEIQILHTHGYKTDIIGLLATLRTSCRVVSTPHGWSLHAGIKLKAYEALDRAVFPFFNAVAPLSDTIFNDLSKLPYLRSKLYLIRNSVDLSEIDAINSIPDQILSWKNDGYFIIGYIGQLITGKGLDILLEAFSKLVIPKKKLILLGGGAQRQDLEEIVSSLEIQNEVAFLGFRDDRLNFLKGFDIFVLPSRSEGIPRCLMEAMAAQVTVIASDIPGCTDLIKHEQTGLLFEVDNVESLLNRLNQCTNIYERIKLSQGGRDFITSNFSAHSMAYQYQKLYEKIL